MTAFYLENPERLLACSETQLHSGVWTYNTRSHAFSLSPLVQALYGVTTPTVPSRDATMTRIHPEDRERVSKAMREAFEQGKAFSVQHRLLHPNGREYWLVITGDLLPDAGGQWLGFIQDLTELVETRQRADQLAHQLESTLEHINDGFFTLDHDWQVTFVNSRAAEIVRRSRERLLGHSLWELFPEGRDSDFQKHYEHTLATGETSRFTAWYGEDLNLWFEVTAYRVPEGLAVYIRDITAEHLREEALKVAEERFNLLASATNDVIWDWDFRTGKVWWNENLHTQFGHHPEQVEPGPESWSRRIHPDDQAAVLDSINAVINGSAMHWVHEYRFLHADGSPRIVVDRGVVTRDDQGRAIRMLGSMIDITEQRALEQRVQQAQKMEAVGQLTGGVAHDFNNLLTVLIGNAERLAEDLAKDSPLQSLAALTLSTAERGAELTNRLLAFARQQALQPRVLRLDQQIAGMEALLRRTLSESIAIEQISGDGLWSAEVDPGQFEVALLNLAINARDAMPRGGRLTLETANAWLDEDYAAQHNEVTPGPYVRVSISDSGEGMPPDVLARAFEPFFTTKEVGQGSGLGLSMVFGFVKQSGGHIKLYSEVGEGTSVKLYFPRTDTTVEVETPKEPQPLPTGHEHVLVVEDDQLVREHLVSQLQSLGYRVSSAGDGPAALEQLAATGEFDLLLTDVIMPGGLNGPELAERVRAQRPGLRVLYTSGYTENAIVHQGRLDAGVTLLGKPWRREELARKVREVLDSP
ncbi:MAG: hybrid sensor histidine kinase/response regulator [Haliea sp.]|nr:hybrid sensor histidine kinase/response regulator [Haliea sp.]|tara:strand:- start:228805 stop:231069 length:2265 start_codon:yes stop_codon:yes gene_type:complete